MHVHSGHGLRPRSIGEILDLTFQVYRERFAIFASLGVAIGVMRLIIGLAWTFILFQVAGFPIGDVSGLDPDQVGAMLGVFSISIPLIVVAFLVVSAFGVLGMTATTEDAFLGKPSSLGSVLGRARSRVVQGACASLLTTMLTVVGMCLCCVPGIAAIIICIFTVPLVYLERTSIIGSLSRSWELVLRRGPTSLSTESNWVRIFVVGLVTFLAYLILSLLGQLPVVALNVGSVLGSREPVATPLGPQPAPLALMLPLQLLGAAIQGLFIPFLAIPWTLMYYDIRTRYEGLDLEQAAARLGGASDSSLTGSPSSGGAAPLPSGISPPSSPSPTSSGDTPSSAGASDNDNLPPSSSEEADR